MRRLALVMAALVLIAPSCPREFGPPDYDADATRPFGPYDHALDLVYVGGGSAKGDSMYVVTMPNGEVLGRIDGPDPRGWAFARDDVAYYAVSRAVGPTTIHRLDLRTGARSQLIRDDRKAGQMYYGLVLPVRTPLVLSPNGSEIVVGRLISPGFAWLGRYDVANGALRSERVWALGSDVGGLFLAGAGERYVVVTFALVENKPTNHQLRILDRELRDVAAPGPVDGLPADEVCSAELIATQGGWATVCTWAQSRYANVLMLDGAFRLLRHTTIDLGAGEEVLASAANGSDVTILTTRGKAIFVRSDGRVDSALAGIGLGSIRVPTVRQADRGTLFGQAVRPDHRVAELVRIDTAAGKVTARAPVPVYDAAQHGERLYAIVMNEGGPTRLQRLDPMTLEAMGPDSPLPRRDDVHLGSLITVVPGR